MKMQLLLSALFCLLLQTAKAQPQHYTLKNSTQVQSFLASGFGNGNLTKSQWLLLKDFFPFVQSGTITAIYFRTSNSVGLNYTINNLSISMGQTSIAGFSGSYANGVYNVYTASSTTFTILPGGWIKINLQTPFIYDKALNTIIELIIPTQPSTGLNMMTFIPAAYASLLYGNYQNATPFNAQYWAIPDFGFDMNIPLTKKSNDAAFIGITAPGSQLCGTNQSVSISVSNMGTNALTNLKIGWSVDGISRPVINYSGFIDTFSGYNSNISVLNNVGQVDFRSNPHHVLKFFTYDPNNTSDPNTSNDTQTITLNAVPAVKITPSGPVNICKGYPVNVALTPTAGGQLYIWRLDNNIVLQSSSSQAFTATTFGDYSVETSMLGCTTKDTIHIDTLIVPVPNVSPQGTVALCTDDSVVLHVKPVQGCLYQWLRQSTLVLGAVDTIYSSKNPGNYQVISQMGGCADTSAIITIISKPVSMPVITGANSMLSTDTTGIVSYQWYISTTTIPTPTAIPGATSSSYKPIQAGKFTVKVSNGSCDATSQSYTVSDQFLSITEADITAAIRIYPNPASNQLFINAPVDINVSLTSMDGRIVLQQPANNKPIDISNLASGVYIVRIANKDGVLLKTEKITKLN